jgi:antitoxin (DNA-binding transcriptional repressor) of toxin-antitoxin stability system
MSTVTEEVAPMTSVSVREFAQNPSAMFSRVESGETIEVTRHGKVVAVMTPPVQHRSRYEELVASGAIVPGSAGLTTKDWDKFTHIEVPDDVDPLAILMEMREHER